jgi:hypothetical protein
MARSQALTALILALGITFPRPGTTQIIWTEMSTVGYGVSGGALGLALCWSLCGLDASVLVVIGGGTVLGAVMGHKIGGAAEGRALSEGWPTEGQLWGARVGMVTGFAGLGALTAAVIVDSSGGNGPGDDERLFRNYSLIGAAAGVAFEVMQERAIRSGAVRSASVSLSRRPTGGIGFGVRIPAP